jgi:hypothetical protein
MFYQDNVQTARVDPPALYGAYEREDHEPWEMSACVTHIMYAPGYPPSWNTGRRRNCMKSWKLVELVLL